MARHIPCHGAKLWEPRKPTLSLGNRILGL